MTKIKNDKMKDNKTETKNAQLLTPPPLEGLGEATTTEKYINPYTDFGFKKLFGTEANKDLLISFLNQLILSNEPIVDVTYLPPEQLGRSEADKRAVFDIYCKTDNGSTFIVEMQKAKQQWFKDRSVFYTSFPIQKQAQLGGDWDFKLKPVYFVGVLDFVFNEDKDDKNVFHHDVRLVDTATGKVFYNKLGFIYLEMPKFNKKEEELKTMFEKWLFALKNLPYFQDRPTILQEKIFAKLFNIAELAKMPKEETDAYEENLKIYRDNRNVLVTAEEEGRKKGRKEGIAKVALALYKIGRPIAEIAEATGLDEETLKGMFEINT
jgi:predicted transposase/invertase (TIGR01784 family)